MSSATGGKFIYLFNGISYGSSRLNIANRAIPVPINDIYVYNVKTNKWIIYPDMLGAKVYGNAQYIDGDIYIFNGEYRIKDKYIVHQGAVKNVEIFNPKTSQVSALENNPYPVYYSGSATWNNKIYVFGGSQSKHLVSNQLMEYDPIKDEWKQLADMPNRVQTSGEIVNGVLYTFGGYIGSSRSSKQIHSYDISQDEWNYISEMPKRLSANAIAKHGDFIWLIGDYSNLSRLSVFNTKTYDFFNIKTNILGRRHAGAEIVGDKLYVFGGARESHNSFLSSIQVADISEIEELLSDKE